MTRTSVGFDFEHEVSVHPNDKTHHQQLSQQQLERYKVLTNYWPTDKTSFNVVWTTKEISSTSIVLLWQISSGQKYQNLGLKKTKTVCMTKYHIGRFCLLGKLILWKTAVSHHGNTQLNVMECGKRWSLMS